LANSIRAYARGVESAALISESAEISALLAIRDGITLDLHDGAVLDEGLRRLLAAADERLQSDSDVIAKHFPGFDAEVAIREAIGEGVPASPRGRLTA